MKISPIRLLLATLAALGSTASLDAKTSDGKPLVLLLAGRPSHGPGEHEHNAGVQLLAKCLAQGAPNVATKVFLNAACPTPEELAQADTVVFYCDGGAGHFLVKDGHLEEFTKTMQRGAGFVALHYGVEFLAEKGQGGPEALDWMGGFFEANWSVNPHWLAEYKELPKHPISNGVKPFATTDEWYFHMRFRTDGKGTLTHILSAIAPDSTMSRPDGHHSGNPAVRAEVAAKKPQTTAWAFERPDGGRGFGFTGGHFHAGWGQDDQRKLVLNAILWTAKADVMAGGVESKVSEDELKANLDPKQPRKVPAAPKPAVAPKPEAAAKPADDGDAHATPIFSTPKVTRGPVAIKADLKGAKELHLLVNDAGDGIRADWADWIAPTLIKADGTRVPLTSIEWKSAQQGHGATMKKRNCDNGALKVSDEKMVDGIGTHAPSLISFDLPEGVVGFEAQGAIDDGGFNQNIGSSVIFQVFTTKPGGAALKASADKGDGGPGVSLGFAAAKEGMSRFKAADGLGVSLVAAEPMIQNPTNLDIDPRGRLWATEAVNYRTSLKPWGTLREEGDRVVILEDTNGDDVADKETTFYQSKELTNPLGILVLPQEKGTQVIVSAAPNVWLLTDADGDDKAENAEIIFRVKGNWDHDHQVHAFVFGADGKFYFNCGNESKDLLDGDGNFFTDLSGHRTAADRKPYQQGLVFRCDIVNGKPTNVETLGWNFRNNYEVTVDSFGTMWQSDNDDDGNKGVRINYVMPYGNYGYSDELTGAAWQVKRPNLETEIPLRHWHQNDPGVVPNLLQTGSGSPTGILINEGSALGPQFENQLIHCDAGPRTVRAYPVTNDGAGYKATMVDVLTSEDPWYRPADVAIAPDGSLFVADWYDAGVGGHNMADHDKGTIRGRIYHVAPTGGKLSAPKPDFSTAAGCVAALQSPNRATQYVAWQKLAKLGAQAEADLAKLWKESPNPRHRARALALLVRLPGKELGYLKQAFADANSDLRIAGIRLCVMLATSRQLDTTSLKEDRELMTKLLRDPSPQVRREIAVSLHGAKDIAQIWAVLATQHDGKDRWYLEALGIGATGQEDACFDAWLAMAGGKWNTPAGQDLVWRMRTAKAAGYLAELLEDGATADKPRYLRSFDFLAPSPERTKALVELATAGKVADDIARDALVRLKGTDLNAEPAVAAALKGALDKSKGTPQFVELVRDFGAKGQGAALLETALKIPGDAAVSDAFKLLFAEEGWPQIVNDALAGPNASAVLDLLGNAPGNRGINRLSTIITKPGSSAELRQGAVRSLARTQSGAEALVNLAKNAQFPEELKPIAGNALALVQYASLKDAIAQYFPSPNALGGQPLPPIAELVKLKGDLAKGKATFERIESSCVTCHRVSDKGADFGPGLSEIGSKLPKEALYESIISPNAGVSMGFETWQLSLKDGSAAMGIIRSETADEVIVALPGGVATKLAKNTIAKREKLPTSMMPSGLNQALSKDDLVNLVEYLASLKKP
jgi:putative membrane-bound dehydrogenase-like protein